MLYSPPLFELGAMETILQLICYTPLPKRPRKLLVSLCNGAHFRLCKRSVRYIPRQLGSIDLRVLYCRQAVHPQRNTQMSLC